MHRESVLHSARVCLVAGMVCVLTDGAMAASAVASFALIDAETDRPAASFEVLTDGAVIPLRDGDRFNIEARTSPGAAGAVLFRLYLQDKLIHERLEQRAPYALFGNVGDDYLPWIGEPRAGTVYTLRAWLSDSDAPLAPAAQALEVSFSFDDAGTASSPIDSFTLIDADQDARLAAYDVLADDNSLDLPTLPRLSVQANAPGLQGSIRFELREDGRIIWVQIENSAPFALFGNSGDDFLPWPDNGPQPGRRYEIAAVPYELDGARGPAGTGRSVTLEAAGENVDEPVDEPTDEPAPGSECTSDAACDDDVFCNGVESCAQGQCVSGGSPCAAGQYCIESSGACRTGSWQPPVGIPAPDFGIEEVAPPYNASNPLHYYVDNSHPAATNTNNPRGSTGTPRTTIPLDLPAGAVVEVRGGPYDYISLGAKLSVSGQGTRQQPVFIRGAGPTDRPSFVKDVFVKGRFIVFEHLLFEDHGIELRPVLGEFDHIAIRHCEFAGSGQASGGGTIKIVGNPTMVRDIVLYDNHIHDNGDDSAGAPELGRHGILVSYNTERIWIVDNHIHDNGEDAVQVNFHGTISPKVPARSVYIGRNVMHGDRENALDLKICRDVIVSGNEFYNYAPTPTSNGEALVVHPDQPTAEYPAPQNVWILNNHVHDARLGVVVTGGSGVYVMNNLITDIRHTDRAYDPASVFAGGVGIHARNSGPVYVVHNTVHGCDSAVTTSASVHLWGNVFADIAESRAYHLNVIDSDSVTTNHNLYHQSSGEARIRWGGTDYSLDGFQTATGLEAGGLGADPLISAASGFRLGASSPAVDAAGPLHPAFAMFQARYGRSIAYDFTGAPRVQDSAPDMGAFER